MGCLTSRKPFDFGADPDHEPDPGISNGISNGNSNGISNTA